MEREPDDLDKKLQQFPKHTMSENSKKEIHDTLMKARMSRSVRKKNHKNRWMVGVACVAALMLFMVLGLSFFQGGLDDTAKENDHLNSGSENGSVEIAEDNDDQENDSDDDAENEAELSEDDATKKVFDYVDEHEDVDREDVKVHVEDREDEEGKYTVQAFVFSEGDKGMTNTIGWYEVDKETGEVEGKYDDDSQSDNDNPSDYSNDESETDSGGGDLHQSPDSKWTKEEMDEVIEENVNLPDIYENTVVYNGSLTSEFAWRIRFPEEDEDMGESISVNEDAQFSAVLSNENFEAGDDITFYIVGGRDDESKVKTVEVQPAEDGKEVVLGQEDSSEQIEEATHLPDFYENTTSYYGKTVPNANVHVLIDDEMDNLSLETDENGDFEGDFSNFPNIGKGENNVDEGDTLFFIITDEDGNSSYFEKEVLPASDDPDYDGPVSPDE